MPTLAAIVLFETDDPALSGEIKVATAAEALDVRARVLAHLSRVTRLVAVMPGETAMLMCAAHDEAMREVGAAFARPPAGHVPPPDRWPRR